jgi:hypothetical protein
MRTIAFAVSAASMLVAAGAVSPAENPIDLAAARATDPKVLKWMEGIPPPADKQIRYDDGSYYRFPQWRWSFSHWRELVPTVSVSRGSAPRRRCRRRSARISTQ